MTTNDPIADMLTRIRNANTAKHDTVDVPVSKMKLAIADILVDEGYVEKYDLVDNGNFKDIRITLKYGKDKNAFCTESYGISSYRGTKNRPLRISLCEKTRWRFYFEN